MITDEQVIKALDAYYDIEHVGGARFNLISTMRKALEAYEQSKWQPITSAPKDADIFGAGD